MTADQGVIGKVKNIISKILKVPVSSIDDAADLVEIHGMDSMQRVEIVIEIEKEFDVTISDEQALKLRSVKAIVGQIEGVGV